MADLSNIILKSQGDTLLVCSGGILTFHWHYQPFPESEKSEGRCKSDMLGKDSSLEEEIRYVDFAPDLSFGTVSKNVIDTRERKDIQDSYFIQYAVVHHPVKKDSWISLGIIKDDGWMHPVATCCSIKVFHASQYFRGQE